MPKVELAQLAEYPQVKGLFVGGCVERGDGSRFRALAHAHTSKQSLYHGWICVLSTRRALVTESGNLSQIMLHEVAHIISGDGHTDKWRKVCKEIGYRLPLRYKKHVRKPIPKGESIVKRGRNHIIYKDGRIKQIMFAR